jgi:hypothetical protein
MSLITDGEGAGAKVPEDLLKQSLELKNKEFQLLREKYKLLLTEDELQPFEKVICNATAVLDKLLDAFNERNASPETDSTDEEIELREKEALELEAFAAHVQQQLETVFGQIELEFQERRAKLNDHEGSSLLFETLTLVILLTLISFVVFEISL